MRKNNKVITAIVGGLFSLVSSVQSAELTQINWCVFDVLGASGPAKEMVDDYKIKALRWGVELKTQFYIDEQEAAEQFDEGACDLVNLPDFRARKYNHFTGSINAVGAIPDYKHLGVVIQTLASNDAQPLMTNGEYEVFGISLIGGLHSFLADRTWVTPELLVGKRISILEGVEESDYLNQQTGMLPVKSGLADVFNNFNNKLVDATVAPLVVYEGLEMNRGLGVNGGISRYPFAMATMQLIARWEKFPEGMGQKSREFVADSHVSIVRTIKSYEEAVPDNYWFDIPLEGFYYWDNLFSRSRRVLAEQGVYDVKMIKLLRKVRCQSYPDRAECF